MRIHLNHYTESKLFGLIVHIANTDCCFSSPLIELCLRNLNSLSSIGLINMDEDINIKPTGRREVSLNVL